MLELMWGSGIVITIACMVLLVKRYDAKMVLIGSGFIMCGIGGVPMAGLDAFAKSMTNSGLIQAVCSVMGFAMAMRFTGCDKHLINALASVLGHVRPLVIPGVVVGTYFVNVALPSAAGTAAAAGAIFIPLLIQEAIDRFAAEGH